MVVGDNELKKDVLKEVIRIGDWLLSIAKKDDSGMWWESIGKNLDHTISWSTHANVYSGVSGIVLFLLELGKLTGESRYKTAAIDGMRWTLGYCEKNPSYYYAFFTGRMGIVYTLLKVAEATGESRWREKALEIARLSTYALEAPRITDDLINGDAGTVVGLLHLHAATGEPWILKTIDSFVERLIHRAHQGPKGLYWGRSGKIINGLCGFSHGAAGVGWVFLELGRYFNNDTFYRVATQAFLYETLHYDEIRRNWKDLRQGVYDEEDEAEHRNAYLENNLAFFTRGGIMNGWCHGAAGIGLSRLRALKLFKNSFDDDSYKLCEQDMLNAIEKTIRTDTGLVKGASFILCHGSGGNAELFLEAYNVLNDKKYLALAEDVARRALAYREKNNMYISGYGFGIDAEDTSLFMGTAGIGYFYLRLLAPHDVPSILAPTLNAPPVDAGPLFSYSSLTISQPGIAKHLLKKYFKRTLTAAEKFLPRELAAFFNNAPLNIKTTALKDSFAAFMKKNIPSLPPKKQTRISDVFTLEWERIKVAEAVVGFSYISIKEKLLAERGKELAEMADDAFLNLALILEPGARITTTEWNWYLTNETGWSDNINREPGIFPLLLKPTPTHLMEESLPLMTYAIFGAFENGATVEKAVRETFDAFDSIPAGQEDTVKGEIIEQVKQALLAGILVEHAQ